MARLADLKLVYRMLMQVYPYRRIDWRLGERLSRPRSESRISLVTSAGFFAPGRPPFDSSICGGDLVFSRDPLLHLSPVAAYRPEE
jgi:hypothetical protein